MKRLTPHYSYPTNELPPIIGQFSVVWERDGDAWGETLYIKHDLNDVRTLQVYNPANDTFEEADEGNSAYLYDMKTCPDRMHAMILFTMEE